MNNYEPHAAAAARRSHQDRRRGLAPYNRGNAPDSGGDCAAAAAIAFCCAAYVYLTLPDVRALRTSNPPPPRSSSCGRARPAPADKSRAACSAGSVCAHLAQPQARGARGGGQRVLAARRASTTSSSRNRWRSTRTRGVRARREHHHAAAREEPLSLAVEESDPQGARAVDRPAPRGGALEAAHPRALSERHRVGRRDLRRRGGRADAISASPLPSLAPQESALLAAAIVNPRRAEPGHPTARLRRRQQMIMRRMGAVTPPPVVAEPRRATAGGMPRRSTDLPCLSPAARGPAGRPSRPAGSRRNEPVPVKPCAVPPCR